MYLFQRTFLTFCIAAVLCQRQIRNADAANYEKGSSAVNDKENVEDDDDGQGINYEDVSDMYGTLNKKLTRLTDYAQDKVRRSTSATLNNLIEKNANTLKQHLNTIQSTRSLKEMKQEKHDRHAAASSALNSLRIGKVLNVLAPYYDNHEKKFVGNDITTNADDSKECGSSNENNNDKDISCNDNSQRKTVTNAAANVNVIEMKLNSPKRNSGKFEKFSTESNDDMFASLLAHSCEICPPEYATADFCCNKERPAKHKRQTFENPTDKRRTTYDSKATNPQPQYPDVVAKSAPNLGGYKLVADDNNNQIPSLPYVQPIQTDAKSPYADFLNYYDQQRLQLTRRDNNNNISLAATTTPIQLSTERAVQSAANLTQTSSTYVPADCAKYMDDNNATSVLERVLEELELIRAEKNGSLHPEGAPCDIRGSWNSEIIGLRFDINETTTPTVIGGSHELPAAHDLSITLFDHSPPRRNTLMDTNWTCSGNTLHNKGGPFYIYAAQKKEQVLATFTGVCKTCGGVDTIFGTWSFVHPAKDCHDLQMSIETKRDIFRKEMLYVKKIQKLERLKSTNNNTAGEANQQQQSEATSDQVPSSTTSTSAPIPEIRSVRRYY